VNFFLSISSPDRFNFDLSKTSPLPRCRRLPIPPTHASSHANSCSSPPYSEALSHNGRIHRLDLAPSYTPLTSPPRPHHPPTRHNRSQCASPPVFQVPPLRLLHTSRALLFTTPATIQRLHLVPSLQPHHLAPRRPFHPPRDPHPTHRSTPRLLHNPLPALSPPTHY
jgi:hypothetical protein